MLHIILGSSQTWIEAKAREMDVYRKEFKYKDQSVEFAGKEYIPEEFIEELFYTLASN